MHFISFRQSNIKMNVNINRTFAVKSETILIEEVKHWLCMDSIFRKYGDALQLTILKGEKCFRPAFVKSKYSDLLTDL
jgi:hypothetical protein